MRDIASREVTAGRGRDRASRRRSPGRCSSATSPSSSTRATPRWPSAGPPRCRSTRPCWPSCSAAGEGSRCATCSTPRRSRAPTPSCSASTPGAAARDAEDVADLLRVLGPLPVDGVVARPRGADAATRGAWLGELEGARRVDPGARRRRGALGRRRGRRPAARRPRASRCRSGVPQAFPEPVADPLGDLVAPYARTHGPFTAAEVAAGSAWARRSSRDALRRLVGARPASSRASCSRPDRRRPAAEFCDAEVLRTAAPPLARRAARRGRAGHAADARPVPAAAGRASAGRPARRRGRDARGRAAGGRRPAGQRPGVARAAGPRADYTPAPCSTS